ncbi:MAG: hypothetical protein KJO79_00710, partial [Verrucomicrobiae bacterium]|nr:hypothetical protein [Verrucomicrobiae bacterium]
LWAEHAMRSMAWYTGFNDLGIEVYDRVTGGCHDALLADHINHNQGAESTIACHLAIVEMMLAEKNDQPKEEPCKR